jgi:tetratricopeptide (TPR) repeat protein
MVDNYVITLVIETIIISLTAAIGLGFAIFVILTSLKSKASKYAFGGAVHALMGKYEYADIRYKKALEFDRENFDALYYLAQRHANQREFSQAVSFYERCLRQKPDDPNILFKLGAVFYSMNHMQRAVELWKKFIAKSRNEQNVKMATELLQKIGKGEKEILSDVKFLYNFRWHEEGLSASKKITIFLIACAVEFVLLLITLLISLPISGQACFR